MIKKNIQHSIRSFSRQKTYLLINVLGLSIGIACSLLIALYVFFELSYDNFHENKDRIHRIILDGKIGGQEIQGSFTASPVGPTMFKDFPEVEDYCRLNFHGETAIKYKDIRLLEQWHAEADSSFFKIFSVPLIKGNKTTALDAPYKVVLSETTAKKIFGNEDPMNKMIQISTDTSLYKVTGVYKDIPDNSHFNARFISSFLTNKRSNDGEWLANSFSTYLLLKPGTDPKNVDKKIPGMLVDYVGPRIEEAIGITWEELLSKGNKYSMYLQPLSEIHLNPEIQQDAKPANNPKYLYIFGSIAILIVIIASINFMNLSTAQAAKRAKEVGIKKVSGSSRTMLINQFLTESLLLAFLSLIVAIIVVQLTLPYFNNLLQTKLELNLLSNWHTIPALVLLAILVGLLAGSYPAFYLSGFKPVRVLKGSIKDSMKNGKLRSVLVVLQFSISIILIVGTLIMFRQIQYMQNKDLGFDKEHLLVLNRADIIGNKIESFKEELNKLPDVVCVTASTALPSRNNNNNGHMVEGRRDETLLLETAWADYDFIETFGMEMAQGRFFDRDYPSDKEACVINESTDTHNNFTDPLKIRFLTDLEVGNTEYMQVIGVVKDFHFRSLQTEITPYIIIFKNEDMNWGYITARISGKEINKTVHNVEQIWKDFSNNEPIQYFFLDESFNNLYKEEARNSTLAIIFTVLAIVIASLGLFGLTSFTVEQRTKEIGIRKAMGASIVTIFYLISKEIILLISVAALIAAPVIYFVGNNWLQNYHYKISLSPFYFIIGFLIALFIALLTITYRTLKAAKTNPAQSLRYE